MDFDSFLILIGYLGLWVVVIIQRIQIHKLTRHVDQVYNRHISNG